VQVDDEPAAAEVLAVPGIEHGTSAGRQHDLVAPSVARWPRPHACESRFALDLEITPTETPVRSSISRSASWNFFPSRLASWRPTSSYRSIMPTKKIRLLVFTRVL